MLFRDFLEFAEKSRKSLYALFLWEKQGDDKIVKIDSMTDKGEGLSE